MIYNNYLEKKILLISLNKIKQRKIVIDGKWKRKYLINKKPKMEESIKGKHKSGSTSIKCKVIVTVLLSWKMLYDFMLPDVGW